MRNDSIKTEANDDTLSMADSFVQVMDDAVMVERSLELFVTPRHAIVGTNNTMSTTQVCVTVTASELLDDGKRAPIDLVIALDCSGSMDGEKLELCKTTLERIIRSLSPTDRFGLISFATEAMIEIPAQKMNEENKRAAIAKIKALRTRGCTNISAAIGLAAQEMNFIGAPNEVRTIFLLTDGLANEGITSEVGMVKLAENCLAGNNKPAYDTSRRHSGVPTTISTSSPITLHCFGYGKEHDSQLLTKLATSASTGGTYYFVENDKNVGEAFGDALGGIFSVVAQSTVVNISVSPEVSARGVSIVDVFHDQKVKREDGSYSVTIGDFYAEESRDVVLEVTLANFSGEKEFNPVPHLTVSVSYIDTLQKQPVSLGPVTCFISRPPGRQVSEENQHVVVQWLRITTTNMIATAQECGRSNNRKGAQESIRTAMQAVLATPYVQADPLVKQLASDLWEIDEGLASADWNDSGSHVMMSRLQQHRSQRCSDSNNDSGNFYRGKTKTKMSAAFKFS